MVHCHQSERVKGGPQTFVYDAFLLFQNQKRDRAHVEEFQHAQHESPVYDRRELTIKTCLHFRPVAVILN